MEGRRYYSGWLVIVLPFRSGASYMRKCCVQHLRIRISTRSPEVLRKVVSGLPVVLRSACGSLLSLEVAMEWGVDGGHALGSMVVGLLSK